MEDASLRDRPGVFADRREAGRALATALLQAVQGNEIAVDVVFAIPAGGIPVAVEVARALSLPLEPLVVRKLRIPGNPEAGFGAVDPEGHAVLNEDLLGRLRLGEVAVAEEKRDAFSAVRRREELLRHTTEYPPLAGKDVVIVDDGLASGYTMLAASRFVRRRGAARVAAAVPTGQEDTARRVLREVDALLCLNIRSGYPFAVADAYGKWYDVAEEEAASALEAYRLEKAGGGKA